MVSAATDQRSRLIVIASWVGISLNALLAVAKLSVGLAEGSFAVLSDGVDSGVDILTSMITLLAARLMTRPPDKRFPYGYSRIDPLATKILSFILFFSGVQLVGAASRNLIQYLSEGSGSIASAGIDLPGIPSLLVTGISIGVKALLAWYKVGLGKKIKSAMLVADGKNMSLDIITSFVVLFSVILGKLTGTELIDSVTGILVSLWIMWTAISIYMETNIELMDGLSDTDIYQKIISSVEGIEGLFNPHRIRVRKMGHLFLIVMDIEVAPDMSIAQAHAISLEAESRIMARVENIYDIIIHIDPLGLKEDEKYGLSADSV